MLRWALGLAILFAVLALVARILQFGFSLILLVVAGLALVAAAATFFAGRGNTSGPPPR